MHTVFCTSNTNWQKDRQIHTRTHAHTHTHTCTRARAHTHTHARPHIHTSTTGGNFNFALTQIYLTMWGAHSASLCWKMQSTIGVSSPSDGNGTSLLVKCDCHSTTCTQIHALIIANTKWDCFIGKRHWLRMKTVCCVTVEHEQNVIQDISQHTPATSGAGRHYHDQEYMLAWTDTFSSETISFCVGKHQCMYLGTCGRVAASFHKEWSTISISWRRHSVSHCKGQ